MTRDASEIASGMMSRAFDEFINNPNNQNLMRTILEEEGLEDLLSVLKNPAERKHGNIYPNFVGLIRYESLSNILDFSFKPIPGQKRRTIADAIAATLGLARPGEGPTSEREGVQIRSLVPDDTYLEEVNQVIRTSRENGHRGLFAAAAALAADDLDAQELGYYANAAFSTLKKAASASKPPELHIADYMGKDDPMVAQVKTADREARKASRK